jgi:predicted transglutaminase-like cysteine proteinase
MTPSRFESRCRRGEPGIAIPRRYFLPETGDGTVPPFLAGIRYAVAAALAGASAVPALAEPVVRPQIAFPAADHIVFGKRVLAPMAYTLFCVRYQGECPTRTPALVFRGGLQRLTAEKWSELREVNTQVNHAIHYDQSRANAPIEQWNIAPARGICNDYAVTKRHELMQRGWPRRTLLLAEVATGARINHTVLVVRTRDGDVVLDNMTQAIRKWSETSYRWVRIQLPHQPRLWAKVGGAHTTDLASVASYR